jgi:hypothetical protein
MRLAAEISAAFALLFAGVVRRVYRDDLLVEERFDRSLDLDLVARGATRNTYLFSFSLSSDDFSVSDAVWMISKCSFILSLRLR